MATFTWRTTGGSSPTAVRRSPVSSEGMVVRVLGRGLELVSMTGDALRIRGEIQRVEWER